MPVHHGKTFIEARGKVDREHEYAPAEAMRLLKEVKRAKFDESVEVHVRTGLNVRHADEQLRGTIALPNGLGKTVTVAVFAKGDKAREAEEAGADIVGAEDLADRVQNEGFTDFDVAIATPDMMPVVGRLGRILGPQGKMPNPKVGTVTMDVGKAVEESKRAKFDETVEVHIRTGLNVRHADEQLRGTIALPHGLGKEVKIAVFAKGDKAREAEEAGADFVGADDLAKRIQDEGFTGFDVAIATPDMMPVVGRLGRILGPQGKMPNPKVGTVTMDVRKAVEESKAGKVEYRTDRTAIVHMTLGKTSFEERQLLENYQAIVEELIRAKPSAAKGKYLRTITVASTMGPGIKVDPSKTRDLIEAEAEAAA